MVGPEGLEPERGPLRPADYEELGRGLNRGSKRKKGNGFFGGSWGDELHAQHLVWAQHYRNLRMSAFSEWRRAVV